MKWTRIENGVPDLGRECVVKVEPHSFVYIAHRVERQKWNFGLCDGGCRDQSCIIEWAYIDREHRKCEDCNYWTAHNSNSGTGHCELLKIDTIYLFYCADWEEKPTGPFTYTCQPHSGRGYLFYKGLNSLYIGIRKGIREELLTWLNKVWKEHAK